MNIMKKVYIAPQTEAIEILGTNAIMAASSGFVDQLGGFGSGSGTGDMM
jgi:hypothetical protein